MSLGPRKLLLNDEGSSALHYIDGDDAQQNWTSRGPGRDLQLIGRHCVLRSTPGGFVEVDLRRRGEVVREVAVTGLPGGVESARRLLNGHTIVIGNGGGGVFVWELDRDHQPVPARRRLYAGLEKARLIRLTEAHSFLFCSETNGRSRVHEGTWEGELSACFEAPADVPADSMVKATRIGPNTLAVTTGYAASLLVIDLTESKVVQTIGGTAEPTVIDAAWSRPVRPFFFSGYQKLANGDFLVANWQGHGPGHHHLGFQVLRYSREGTLRWAFDQTQHPAIESINNVIALDGLDLDKLHDEQNGALVPLG